MVAGAYILVEAGRAATDMLDSLEPVTNSGYRQVSDIMEKQTMSNIIVGVVNNGVVIPNAPLPEGAKVHIHLNDVTPDVPPELQEELAAWQQASANSLALVERLAEKSEADEKR